MKRVLLCLLSVLFFPLLTDLPADADETEKGVNGEVGVGFRALSHDKVRARVGEFDRLNNLDGIARVELEGQSGTTLFDLDARFADERDQEYGLDLDFNRIFRAEFDYNRLFHWLDHDSLENIDAAILPPSLLPNPLPANNLSPDPTGTLNGTNNSIGRQTVYHTDLSPGKDYFLVRDEATLGTELLLPQAPGLKLYFDARGETRHGFEQARAISHCASCHVVAKDRRINERLWDKKIGATYRTGLLTLDYSFLDREFDEQADAPVNFYDPGLHPLSGGGTPEPFRNRIAYDYDTWMGNGDNFANGVAVPFYKVPDSGKRSHVVKANLDLPGSMNAFASYVNTEITNNDTVTELNYNGSQMDYESYLFRFNSMVGKKFTFSLKGRLENMDNEDVFVDINEPTSNLTPTPQNYAQQVLSTSSVDFRRESVLDQDIVTLGFDSKYRLARWTTLRLQYEFQQTERESFEGAEETQVQTVKLGMNSRAAKNLTYNLSYKYQNIDEPFQNLKGGCAPDTSLGFTLNTAFLNDPARQYDAVVYSNRDPLTNQPTEVHQFVGKTTWSPRSNFSTTLSYNFKHQKNSDLNLLTWKDISHNAGISFWYTPTQDLALTAAYDYLRDKTDAIVCVALYDG